MLTVRGIEQFDLRSKEYTGRITTIWRAVDCKTGITVGIKVLLKVGSKGSMYWGKERE